MADSGVIAPRADVTRQDIERVVAAFYTKARVHPILGPVFMQTIGDQASHWVPHEVKIVDFWANAILSERSYSDNPMLVHSGISAIKPDMFDQWLGLFQETLNDCLTEQVANQWNALARRIGRGLRMGVEQSQMRTDQPPDLRMF